jgi:hypothetical protein
VVVIIGGVFGGSAPTLNTNAGSTYSSTLQRIGQNLGDLTGQQTNQYQGDQANANRANNAYSQYLQTDPSTYTYNAQQIAGAERGASEGAQAAKANLSSDLASRGIGANSSMAVGGLSAVDQGLAANDANIRAQQAEANINRRAQNLEANSNLWGGLAGNDYSRATSTAGQQAGIESGLLSEADQLAMDKYNQQVAQNNASNSLWGSLAGAAATAF